jgi:cell wall-associated NlpC family hydrolase
MARDGVVSAAKKIIDSKKYSYDKGGNREEGWLDDDKMDCSEFVLQSYRRAGFVKFPAVSSHMMAKIFASVRENEVEAGDIVYWSTGHAGIVVNPSSGTFAGAQSSGLAIANYKQGWWASRGDKKFLRYSQ